ncbi:MAG: hypothetical protein WEB33_10350 [Bacteroidota bacterium]
MEPGPISRHVGITPEEYRAKYSLVKFFNHEHGNPAALATIGTISVDEIARVTGGVFAEPLEITINRKVIEYVHCSLVTVHHSSPNKLFICNPKPI